MESVAPGHHMVVQKITEANLQCGLDGGFGDDAAHPANRGGRRYLDAAKLKVARKLQHAFRNGEDSEEICDGTCLTLGQIDDIMAWNIEEREEVTGGLGRDVCTRTVQLVRYVLKRNLASRTDRHVGLDWARIAMNNLQVRYSRSERPGSQVELIIADRAKLKVTQRHGRERREVIYRQKNGAVEGLRV